MSYHDIQDRIIDLAKQQAKDLLLEAQAQGEKNLVIAQEHAKRAREQVIATRQPRMREIDTSLSSKELHHGAQLMDQARSEALREVQKQSQQKISSLSEAQHKNLLTKLLSRLPELSGSLRAGTLSQALLKELTEGTPHSLSDEVLEDEAGFIYDSEEFYADYRFSRLVQEAYEEVQDTLLLTSSS